MNELNYATPDRSTASKTPSLFDGIGKYLVNAMRKKRTIAPVAKQPNKISEFRHGDYSAANRNMKLDPKVDAANKILLVTTLQSMR